jgi:hypothetical protein
MMRVVTRVSFVLSLVLGVSWSQAEEPVPAQGLPPLVGSPAVTAPLVSTASSAPGAATAALAQPPGNGLAPLLIGDVSGFSGKIASNDSPRPFDRLFTTFDAGDAPVTCRVRGLLQVDYMVGHCRGFSH